MFFYKSILKKTDGVLSGFNVNVWVSLDLYKSKLNSIYSFCNGFQFFIEIRGWADMTIRVFINFMDETLIKANKIHRIH
jgi:hypothetical protein